MARGKTLLKLLNDYRAEARLSQNPAHNAQVRDSQVSHLQRVQEWLWQDFDWPHMKVERQIAVQAGQRYYDLPADLDIERIDRLDLFADNSWRPLDPSISGGHYSVWNSDLDQRSWPPRGWRIYEDQGVEIWPIPDQNADATTRYGYLKFTGTRRLNPLVDDADTADLDDRLVVLYAAAETLAAGGSKDAQLKLSQANKLNAKLRGGLTPRSRFRMFGVGSPPPDRRHYVNRYRPAYEP